MNPSHSKKAQSCLNSSISERWGRAAMMTTLKPTVKEKRGGTEPQFSFEEHGQVAMETLKRDSIYNSDVKPGESRLDPFHGMCFRRIDMLTLIQKTEGLRVSMAAVIPKSRSPLLLPKFGGKSQYIPPCSLCQGIFHLQAKTPDQYIHHSELS